METFSLKLLTPTGLLLDEQVKSVTLPSANGQMGVLPGHTRYVGVLGVGICEVEPAEGSSRKFVIAGGFCSFGDQVLQILADSVDTKEEIDMERYGKDRKELETLVAHGSTYTPEWQQASKKLHRIEAIDRLVGRSAL
ncbi:MAG: ATP synthase F1 subunit epsilon [Bdellovibrionota bacterium]|nr:MAG: ATP synthase F1 subunit epsilon [Bdellovibrionota bacterium]